MGVQNPAVQDLIGPPSPSFKLCNSAESFPDQLRILTDQRESEQMERSFKPREQVIPTDRESGVESEL